jgi:hypothetical protein
MTAFLFFWRPFCSSGGLSVSSDGLSVLLRLYNNPENALSA